MQLRRCARLVRGRHGGDEAALRRPIENDSDAGLVIRFIERQRLQLALIDAAGVSRSVDVARDRDVRALGGVRVDLAALGDTQLRGISPLGSGGTAPLEDGFAGTC